MGAPGDLRRFGWGKSLRGRGGKKGFSRRSAVGIRFPPNRQLLDPQKGAGVSGEIEGFGVLRPLGFAWGSPGLLTGGGLGRFGKTLPQLSGEDFPFVNWVPLWEYPVKKHPQRGSDALNKFKRKCLSIEKGVSLGP